jgi:hypothetical protein
MAQTVIEVDGVPTLFSPVLAHSLEPGDLICDDPGHSPPRRVAAVLGNTIDGVLFDLELRSGVVGKFSFRANSSVLRAVGARASRGGAR